MLELFCSMTGRQDLYQQNGLAVQAQIQEVLDTVAGRPQPTALLIRAYSSGAKAKGDDNLAGVILRDLGADNLVTRHESLLEDLSLEAIIAGDPDYIFIVYQGSDPTDAKNLLDETLLSNPAWSTMRAVEEGRCIVLEHKLYNLKPNDQWGTAYDQLAQILYGEETAE